jgi:hypothetical protein
VQRSAGGNERATAQSAHEAVPLQLKESAGQLTLTWDARANACATVLWVGADGQRVTLAQDLRGGGFEVILSDGLNSTRQAVRR